MEELHLLLHSLGRQQIKVLKKYLTSFSTRNESESKTWDLAEMLLRSEKNVPTLDECSRKLYHCPKDSKIEKLKSRLQNKIFDSLMIDINIDRKGTFDELDYMIIRVVKKTALFQTLRLSSKHKEVVNHVLDEIISIAKKYEMYGVIVDNLKHKKWAKGWAQGMSAFNKINNEIAFYEHCNSAVNKAIDNYYKTLMHANFEGKQDEKKVQGFLQECIAEMNTDYAYTKSAVVGYYLRWIEIAFYQNEKDFSAAKQACESMLALIRKNPSVYRKSRLGACYDTLAECDIYLRQYEEAITNARASQSYFAQKSSSYYISKGTEFLALFYADKIDKANEACQVLLGSTAARQGDFRVAKYNYFNGCVQFKLGNMREALRILSMKFELSKDKLGWEIAIRVLRIMTLVEMGKYDEAQQQIVSLQKHMERHARKGEVHERDRLILRLLLLCDKEGFRRHLSTPEIDNLLVQLGEKGKSWSWQPQSPEMIPVHQWLIEKFELKPEARPVPVKKAKKVA